MSDALCNLILGFKEYPKTNMAWQYRTRDFPQIYTPKSFFFLTKIKPRVYFEIVSNKSAHYQKEKKLKSDGIRFREIYKPDYVLKTVLKNVNKKYISKINFPRFIIVDWV